MIVPKRCSFSSGTVPPPTADGSPFKSYLQKRCVVKHYLLSNVSAVLIVLFLGHVMPNNSSTNKLQVKQIELQFEQGCKNKSLQIDSTRTKTDNNVALCDLLNLQQLLFLEGQSHKTSILAIQSFKSVLQCILNVLSTLLRASRQPRITLNKSQTNTCC